MRRKEIFTTVSNTTIEIRDVVELIQQPLTKKQDKNDKQKNNPNKKET